MRENLESIRENFISELTKIKMEKDLDNLRVKFLGKKGVLTGVLKNLRNFDIEIRKQIGQESNKLKSFIEETISSKKIEVKKKLIDEKLKSTDFDITLPKDEYDIGSLHPVTIVQKEIEKIFTGIGFMIADGPELETDYFNFEALNVPKHHPARDMQDTYWMEDNRVLRTQTSAVQGRTMKKIKPPLRIIAPGRCFRNEALDACHENTFFQLEGMVIDKDISISNLIYAMRLLLTKVFGRDDIKVRLRPGYFPFVEPGFELDLNCLICGGKGCPTCKYSGWTELLPCGMIHPNVLIHGGIDPEEYTGFAFGLGLTRLAMMKYGISDIRALNSGDLRILKQIGVR
ncbi:MAG: phenylalanine--tRNA ligase subunit alpha [Clostridiales bacterium]